MASVASAAPFGGGAGGAVGGGPVVSVTVPTGEAAGCDGEG